MRFGIYVVGASVFLSSASAWALGRGLDPMQTPVLDPRNGQPTAAWRLAGYTPGGASSVQISPQWILTSKHGMPASDSYFVNGFGLAQVLNCYPHDSLPFPQGLDLAVCQLRSAISVPVGFHFPTLVESPLKLAQDKHPSTFSRNLGAFLKVGYGNPNLGHPRYVWSDFLSLPINDASPGSLGLEALAPYVDGGDSGSPSFWFPQNSTKIGLFSIQSGADQAGPLRLNYFGYGFGWTSSAPVNPFVQTGSVGFSQSVLTWVSGTIQSHSNDVIQTSTAIDFNGPVKTTPSWLGRHALYVKESTPTSVKLDWSRATVSSDTQRYLLFIQQGVQSARSVFIDSSVRESLQVGLVTGVPYTACVLPMGAGGLAPMGSVVMPGGVQQATHWDFSVSCTPFELQPAPSSIKNLSVQVVAKDFGAAGVWPTEQISWSRPATPGLPINITYRVNWNVGGLLQQTLVDGTETSGGARVIKGQRICVSVTPVSPPATVGPASPEQCVVIN